MTTSPPPRRTPRLAPWTRDVAAMAWVFGAAAALLAPALAHGSALGPYDWLSQVGLSAQPGVVVHNRQTFDQITQMVPWTSLAWTQVHHGHLPLWNPYGGLGLPLAFNWQSATFSVPALAGYLAPLHLAYTVEVLVALAIAGSGMYVFARVLGLGTLGCVMAAMVYELSGPIVGWLGWPVAWVMAWAGWLFAATVLVLRGRHRAAAVAFLALVGASAVYGGQPDTLALLGFALVVFVVVAMALRMRVFGGSGPLRRPVLDLALAAVGAVALAAPLLLPGLQLTSGSVRGGKGGSQALPASDLVHVILQGFDGLPVAGGRWFGASFYVRTAAYVGVVAVVLAALGARSAVRQRREHPEAVALGAVAIASAAVVFVPPVVSLMDAIPSVGPVTWNRALLPMAFALAGMAGVGTHVAVRSWGERSVRRWVGAAFGLAGAVLVVLWVVGRGHLPPAEASVRARSFLWPALATAGGLLVVVISGAALRRPGRHRAERRVRDTPDVGWWAGAALLVIETGLLVGAGAPLPSSSPTYLAPTPAEAALVRTVGDALVGFGTNACFTAGQLGIVPDVNAAFGVRELAVYDPLFPKTYYSSWQDATGLTGAALPRATVPFSLFCPAVTSSRVARRYGVGYVLEPPGARGPAGTVLVTTVGGEGLYRVPGAAAFTFVASARLGAFPPTDAPGIAVAADHPDPATWSLVTRAGGPGVVRMRVTGVPGWHATVDGHPVALAPYAGVMLQAHIPPGRHTIVLRYRPSTFTAGVALAGVGVLGLVSGLVLETVSGRARRRHRARGVSAPA